MDAAIPLQAFVSVYLTNMEFLPHSLCTEHEKMQGD